MTVTILHQDGDFLYNADIFKYYEVVSDKPDGYWVYGYCKSGDDEVYLGSYDSMEKANKVLKIIMTSLMYDKSIELPANDEVDDYYLTGTISTLNNRIDDFGEFCGEIDRHMVKEMMENGCSIREIAAHIGTTESEVRELSGSRG